MQIRQVKALRHKRHSITAKSRWYLLCMCTSEVNGMSCPRLRHIQSYFKEVNMKINVENIMLWVCFLYHPYHPTHLQYIIITERERKMSVYVCMCICMCMCMRMRGHAGHSWTSNNRQSSISVTLSGE